MEWAEAVEEAELQSALSFILAALTLETHRFNFAKIFPEYSAEPAAVM